MHIGRHGGGLGHGLQGRHTIGQGGGGGFFGGGGGGGGAGGLEQQQQQQQAESSKRYIINIHMDYEGFRAKLIKCVNCFKSILIDKVFLTNLALGVLQTNAFIF